MRTHPSVVSWKLAPAVLIVLTALFAPKAGHGQVLDVPTRGLRLPGAGLAGSQAYSGVEVNPGQLGLLDETTTALVVNLWSDEVPYPGRGGGFLMATPTFGRSMTLGMGLSFLRPTDALGGLDRTKLSLATGFRLGRAMGLGVVWDHLFQAPYGGTDSFSLGLLWRPFNVVSLGGAVRDINRPRPLADGPRLHREWDSELALRPFGTAAFELGAGVLIASDATGRRLLPHGRLSVHLARGLTLFGEGAKARGRSLDAITGSLENHYAVHLGLVASLDRLAIATSSVGGWMGGDNQYPASERWGGSVVLQTQSRRREALVAGRYVAKMKLTNLGNDRRFIATLVRLRGLATDPKVGAVLFEINNLGLGFGRIEELREVMSRLAAIKPTFASVKQPRTGEYFLASACDTIIAHPAGGLFLGGLVQNVIFFKDVLDTIGVSVDLVRIAEYKGAMEPFVFSSQSQPVRENRDAVLNEVFSRLLRHLSVARAQARPDRRAMKAAIDQALFSPAEAKDVGLVDALAMDDQIEEIVQKRLNHRWKVRNADTGTRDRGRWRPRRVAVIMVDGAINDGKPRGLPQIEDDTAWADPIVDALKAVRQDRSVRAVVLRVNSPGGSAFASDRIAREIVRCKEAGKPVVASMGDTAASGGYYVAAPADLIYASPSTITGSIGIYSFKVDVERLMGRLGLNVETTRRGSRANLFSPYEPWKQGDKETLGHQLSYAYDRFLETVADGRSKQGLTTERLRDLGRGRIYTGKQAKAVGLVDRLGDFGQAVHAAARRGRVSLGPDGTPEMIVLPRRSSNPLDTLRAIQRLGMADASDASDPTAAAVLSTLVDQLGDLDGAARRSLGFLRQLIENRANSIQARMPYDLEIR